MRQVLVHLPAVKRRKVCLRLKTAAIFTSFHLVIAPRVRQWSRPVKFRRRAPTRLLRQWNPERASDGSTSLSVRTLIGYRPGTCGRLFSIYGHGPASLVMQSK